ncbi:MAG TPA: methyl-accepting chemotaxis protein, partial [Blastocatellia bacterium]|nr:methyl-accepting chemotaxis protein [Blastocatellia bacterium]
AALVRKAAAEQAGAARQITSAVESMRRGAAQTSRSLSEQTAAGSQVSSEAVRLAKMIAGVTKAVAEQATTTAQLSEASESIRRQSDQVAKAMSEQARSVKDMTSAARNVAKRVGLITRANQDHVTASSTIMTSLGEIREITERNAQGVKETIRGAATLADRAQTLNVIMDRAAINGRPAKKARSKKKSKR